MRGAPSRRPRAGALAAALCLLQPPGALGGPPERCESDPLKFKPPEPYKIFARPPICQAPYSVPVQSMAECHGAARALQLQGVTVDEGPEASPSAMLGRNLPVGCYYWPRRAQQELQALYWNGGVEVHRTRPRPVAELTGAAAQAICKHDDAHAAVQALTAPEWGTEPRLWPPPGPVRQAQVSHILSADPDAHLGVRVLLSPEGNGSFYENAHEHSLCSSASIGGQLGVVIQGQLVEPLDRAIFFHEAPALFTGSALHRHERRGVRLMYGVQSDLGLHTVLVHWMDKGTSDSAGRKEPPREDADAPPQLGFRGVPRGAGHAAEVGAAGDAAEVAALRERKRAAIEAEDYEEALRLKRLIESMQAPGQETGPAPEVDDERE
eukprot:TRINITY_DN40565_c0_g1_i1.p2 TRINITY_DN40565_c0_g1~~TRINITY_DN40565_c0_g1_i1.p2  ORF type:complete len:380 (+),score=128.54 TRINITY_DN40565_c0_g1_i1:68-1207(+)